MRDIGRGDAVLAVKLWGLAEHRYFPVHVEGTPGPPPTELYAGLRGAGSDPVNSLRSLAEAMLALALEWDRWERDQAHLEDRPQPPPPPPPPPPCNRRVI